MDAKKRNIAHARSSRESTHPDVHGSAPCAQLLGDVALSCVAFDSVVHPGGVPCPLPPSLAASPHLLGNAALSRVAIERVVQPGGVPCPPSLFLPVARLATLVARTRTNDPLYARVLSFLLRAWPRLQAMYRFYDAQLQGSRADEYR
eukprot:351104-Chlamydomonas_euryale.AAC.2